MRKVALVLLLLVLALVAVIATRPSTYHVERSTTIAASPEAVHATLNDLHEFEAWSPWTKLDPNMKIDLAGPDSGVGQAYHWVGNDKVGEGRMTIVESEPAKKVGLKLEFIKPFASTSNTAFSLAPGASGTQVTWSVDGDADFMTKAMSLVKPMDAMIGPDFERGLAQLKSTVEAQAAAPAAAAPADSVR